ncbi:hypothetical protein [Nocardioides zeae]|uniref:hypothetical protein n=1 Tax=Nocardioides zeae TaxID=1457234 RepID=UPI00285D5D52|nr:hypothetical protein [Nocardioides zeae]MDR6175755.1 hypothetical protein [Nocardioides zeae]
MPLTRALPAENTFSIVPVGRSTTTTPLFSCRVTATSSSALIATYSGSGSTGVSMPAAVNAARALPSGFVNGTGRAVHVAGSPVRATVWRKPAGAWGSAAPLASSSRWFSMAIAAQVPSALMAMESGWPPRSMRLRRLPSLVRTTRSAPEGDVNDELVSTTASRWSPTTATDVGCTGVPASKNRVRSRVPRPTGAAGSAMSSTPTRWPAASV